MNGYFKKQIEALRQRHEALLQRPNEMQEETNGIIRRYVYPVLTRQHIPLEWRYDFNPATNPCCMERIGFNATMNSGALKWNGKYLMVVRVEGADRKSFFAIAESPNGVDNFHFWKRPLVLPDVDPAETNVYDMRPAGALLSWRSLTRMDGFMVSFAANAMMTRHRREICRRRWQRRESYARAIWWTGNGCPT